MRASPGSPNAQGDPCRKPSLVAGARYLLLQGIWAAVWLGSALLLVGSIGASDAQAQTAAPSQTDVEAVYLYNFAKFVRWPAGPEQQGPFTICVAGQKALLDRLTKIVAGEKLDSRPYATRLIQTAQDESGCNIVYMSEVARDRADGILKFAADKPVLTVSDMPDFLSKGGMIQFLMINKRIRFSVNLQPVEHSGIFLSSELLKVAVTVSGSPISGGVQ